MQQWSEQPAVAIKIYRDCKKAYLSEIKIAYRDINPEGFDRTEKVLANLINHTYLAYGEKGFGLFNTNRKKGQFADDEKLLSVLPPYAYIPLYKPDWVNLPGTNVKLSDATDDQIWKQLVNHKLTSDYSALGYNCSRWAHEAVRTVGLLEESRRNWRTGNRY
jgi:hypothetical protein